MPFIAIAPYAQLDTALLLPIDAVISILGDEDQLDWPEIGSRVALRLRFDDVGYSSGKLRAASPDDIAKLISFARSWKAQSNLLIHCRAGSSRSPAAAMIALAAVSETNLEVNFRRLLSAKAYYRPNTTMLRLADKLLGSDLVSTAKEYMARDGEEDVDVAVVELMMAGMGRHLPPPI
jgi:predicted protein tyrosine phosphatase